MIRRFRQYFSRRQSQFLSTVVGPLFVLLTFIALMNSIQATNMTKGHATPAIFIHYLISKTFYCWYYVLLAVVLQQLSARVHCTRKNMWRWTGIHLVALIGSTAFHQFLSLQLDTLVWHGRFAFAHVEFVFRNIFMWVDVTIYILFMLALFLLEHQRIVRENNATYSRLEMELLRSQLQEVRSSLHPQFLFTTMESIAELLRTRKNREADLMLSTLSDFLHVTIYDTERDEIQLQEELDFLHQYLAIEKLRHPNDFTVYEHIDPVTLGSYVPSYFLQPLIENFVEQALQETWPPYELHLHISKAGHEIVADIRDNRTGRRLTEHEESKNRTVIFLTKNRLEKVCGEACSLDVTYPAAGELHCRLQMPYRELLQRQRSPAVASSII